MLKLMFGLAISIGIIQYVSAICNVCNENNGVACISEKEFHLCFQGVPNTSKNYSCFVENEICTKFGRVCMDTTEVNVAPACGDTSNCGKCSDVQTDDGMFACTSRTTFTMCFGGQLSDIRGICPDNQICDVNLGKQKLYPCVRNCKEPEIEICDLNDAIDVPVTTTLAPTTTATTTVPITSTTIFSSTPTILTTTTTGQLNTTTETPTEIVCSQQSTVGRYPNNNDTTCKSYIYCYRRSGVMQSTILKCPPEFYFNPLTRLCDRVKPQGCI